MCGFAGYLSSAPQAQPAELLRKMGDKITHRGPDDGGVWWDANAGIGLSHRRLSIVDLSPAGRQPMTSPSGRYVIAFNGEIYNHLELRSMLETWLNEGVAWRGRSDTETLLAGFEAWGIEETIKKTVGMFAFALWDGKDRILTLGRDRLGEKPLYYGWQGNVFLFSSELKSLKAHPAFRAEVDRDSLALLTRHNYIPAPYSIYQGINKLQPGCLMTISASQREPRIVSYWSGREAVERGISNKFTGHPSEAVDALEDVLKKTIGLQMVADVPLGAFLSGGIDSSAVVALMQAQSSRPVRTFSIGFHESQYNEAQHAKLVAQYLGTDHTEMYVTSKDALDVIPRLPGLYDEPFADSSQIPTFLVSKIAKKHVTVSLSGDGGDELFCGYTRYMVINHLWGRLARIPIGVRQVLANAVISVSPRTWDAILRPLRFAWKRGGDTALWGDKMHKGARFMALRSYSELYRGVLSYWTNPASLCLGGTEPATVFTDEGRQPQLKDATEQMMALDLLSYLPDDILTKVDRAAMGVSLETRVPFLDHRVVEFAWRLPLKYKLRQGVSKWVLRQVLYKHVPKELIERPKMGFGVPIDVWLRGPLREWAEGMLEESRLRQEGYFNPASVREKWSEHLSGKQNWQYHLWGVLMFQAWLAENK